MYRRRRSIYLRRALVPLLSSFALLRSAHQVEAAGREGLDDQEDDYGDPLRGSRVQTGLHEQGLTPAWHWDQGLVGFSPQTLTSFYVDGNSEEHFFHDVEKGPEVFRGGMFMMDLSGDTFFTGFHILDPDGAVLWQPSDDIVEGMFQVTATKPGTYTFVMQNTRSGKAMANFFFQTGDQQSLHVDTHQFTSMEDSVFGIKRKLQDALTEGSYLWMRQKAHLTLVETVNTRAYWFCMIELIVLLFLVVFQLLYIKGLITDRQMRSPM
ncbi:unnamed protein product [Amoebophrya sp. A25]|nr:unnamed protein product [Amoebophrya sp. A25]|eukprot:GSA25T00022198001.1